MKRANKVRRRRAALKKDLKAGHVSIYDVALDMPDWLKGMLVHDLLMAVPKIGKVKANRIRRLCHIGRYTPVGVLDRKRRLEVFGLTRKRY